MNADIGDGEGEGKIEEREMKRKGEIGRETKDEKGRARKGDGRGLKYKTLPGTRSRP